ncbi:MAG TPA: hypothetical protein VK762_28570, partial [Polyangiaceae bacterium]|nr:hypothetical protein [Polyangiaceae bacterium]
IENLREFPNIARRLESGALHLSAWVYEIASGDVLEYDPITGQFGPMGAPSIPPLPPSPLPPAPNGSF